MSLNKNKIRLINKAATLSNIYKFADLGGVWLVEGGYYFHILDHFVIEKGLLVDTHFTATVKSRAINYKKAHLVQGNFADPKVVRLCKGVDTVFLFDVLLHQANPHWDEVLQMYRDIGVKTFVIYNQMWIRNDRSVRLLDLGEEAYFETVPANRAKEPYLDLWSKLDQPHPEHNGRLWRDVHHIWQWGISHYALVENMILNDYEMDYFQAFDKWPSREKYFQNMGYIFNLKK